MVNTHLLDSKSYYRFTMPCFQIACKLVQWPQRQGKRIWYMTFHKIVSQKLMPQSLWWLSSPLTKDLALVSLSQAVVGTPMVCKDTPYTCSYSYPDHGHLLTPVVSLHLVLLHRLGVLLKEHVQGFTLHLFLLLPWSRSPTYTFCILTPVLTPQTRSIT